MAKETVLRGALRLKEITLTDSLTNRLLSIASDGNVTRFQVPGASGNLLYNNGSNTIGAEAALSYDSINNALTIGTSRLFTMPAAESSVFLGELAGNFTTTGVGNIGLGYNSLNDVDTANYSTAIGAHTLEVLTNGVRNTAVGGFALFTNITGQHNTGVGYNALGSVTGNSNTALGYNAGSTITTGTQNLALGYNVSVPSNTANGQLSLQNAIYGTSNTGTSTTVSTGNIGFYVTAPTARVHLPAGTAAVNTAPLKFNTGVALALVEDGAVEYHSSHFYVSISAARYQIDGWTTLTSTRVPFADANNRLVDDSVFAFDSTNKSLTVSTARIHTRGTANLFVGESSGNFTLSGISNTGIGRTTLNALTSGSANTALGSGALDVNTSSDNNVAIGAAALGALTGGSGNNIAIGTNAGDNITTGANNLIIGYNIDAQSITGTGQLSIQNALFGTNNTGSGTTVSTGNIGIYVTTPTARLHLPAGTAAVGTAPMKLTSGTALAVIEDGALEYHSSHLYFSIGAARYQLDQQISVGGANTHVLFNDGGVAAGDAQLTWDKTNNILTVNLATIMTPGTNNLFVGQTVGLSGAGNYNNAFGSELLTTITSGAANNAFGHQALRFITTGNSNVAFGRRALATVTTGNGNTALGHLAGETLTGDGNITIGWSAGDNLSTGSYNLILGYDIDAQSATSNNQMTIQNAIFGSSNSTNGTTVASGNLGFWAITWGTSAARVISIGTGTAPSTSIVDGFQMYSKDVVAGNAAPHFRTESGSEIKLYQSNASSPYSISNGITNRTYDANTVVIADLADIVYTLIQDIKATGLLA